MVEEALFCAKNNLSIENMGPRDLQAYNFYDGKPISFEFESGITVDGLNVTGMRNLGGKLMLIQFTDCTVRYKGEVLFAPEDGDFDMAVGKEIVSAFAGAADYHSFAIQQHVSETETIRPNMSPEEQHLNRLYQQVRDLRGGTESHDLHRLMEEVSENHPNDWLLPLELMELALGTDPDLAQTISGYLQAVKTERPEIAHLIEAGEALLNK